MGIAFEMALASLRAVPDWNDPIRAALAHSIIALAKAGERDAERLCDVALQAVSPADPSGWRGSPGVKPPKPEVRPASAAFPNPPRFPAAPRAQPGSSS
jgi:hypothetical protein